MTYPKCPHCNHEIDMSDCDIYQYHTTYHGDPEPQEHQCERCDSTIYLDERVSRTWAVGRTPQEANDNYEAQS